MLEVDLHGRVGELEIAARFEVAAGPLVLTGPNGAGKTSLLAMILGVVPAREGRVAVGGALLFDSERGVRVAPEERGIGYVPQHYGLFPHLSARENVAFALGCRPRPEGRRARRARALELLAELGAAEVAERRASALSGGEQQRVALARALAVEPRALLLDEPLAALDARSRREMRAFLAGYLARLALPTVIVTHDAGDAIALGARLAVLEGGRLVQVGSWEGLRAAPATAYVEELVATAQ